jgi:hypothetical protein
MSKNMKLLSVFFVLATIFAANITLADTNCNSPDVQGAPAGYHVQFSDEGAASKVTLTDYSAYPKPITISALCPTEAQACNVPNNGGVSYYVSKTNDRDQILEIEVTARSRVTSFPTIRIPHCK